MAGIFDAIPVITVILFVIGLVGVMVYERSRSKTIEKPNS
jgi:NADH:ubiquinone oxidoreductase subunit K